MPTQQFLWFFMIASSYDNKVNQILIEVRKYSSPLPVFGLNLTFALCILQGFTFPIFINSLLILSSQYWAKLEPWKSNKVWKYHGFYRSHVVSCMLSLNFSRYPFCDHVSRRSSLPSTSRSPVLCLLKLFARKDNMLHFMSSIMLLIPLLFLSVQ